MSLSIRNILTLLILLLLPNLIVSTRHSKRRIARRTAYSSSFTTVKKNSFPYCDHTTRHFLSAYACDATIKTVATCEIRLQDKVLKQGTLSISIFRRICSHCQIALTFWFLSIPFHAGFLFAFHKICLQNFDCCLDFGSTAQL